ncbi:MAG: Ig-like domain-containing protein [Coriobacteriia bacterium]
MMNFAAWARIRWILLCVVVVALFLGLVPPAMATTFAARVTMEGYDFPDPNGGWSFLDTVTPHVSFAASQTLETSAVLDTPDGYLYTIDHSSQTIPGLPLPTQMPPVAHVPVEYMGPGNAAPLTNGIIDMRRWLAYQVVPYSVTGQSDPVEGVWYLHVRPLVHNDPVLGVTTHVRFGIDITPPPAPSAPSTTTTNYVDPPWQEYAGREFYWVNRAAMGRSYDAMSGDSLWNVYLNGLFVRTFRNWHPGLIHPYASVAIENLRPGRNAVDIRTVDYAGNGSASTLRLYANVDTDTPVIRSMTPASGVIGGRRAFSVDATDRAGVSAVRFEIDNAFVASDTSAPFSVPLGTRTLANGAHTFTAVAYDMIGARPGTVRPHVASSTVNFRVDNTAPRMSVISAGPSPFFPIRRDGYRIRFTLSKDANVIFEAYDSSGTRVRSVSTRYQAGTRTFVWNGARDSGGPAAGTYTWRLRAVDSFGNTSATTRRSVTIRS